jgi:hypothetical protein
MIDFLTLCLCAVAGGAGYVLTQAFIEARRVKRIPTTGWVALTQRPTQRGWDMHAGAHDAAGAERLAQFVANSWDGRIDARIISLDYGLYMEFVDGQVVKRVES